MQDSRLMSHVLYEVDPVYNHMRIVGIFSTYDAATEGWNKSKEMLPDDYSDRGVYYTIISWETNKLYRTH